MNAESSPSSDALPDLVEWASDRRPHSSGIRQRIDRNLYLLRTYPPTQIAERIFKTLKKKAGLRYVPNNRASNIQLQDLQPFADLFHATRPWKMHPSAEIVLGHVTLLEEEHKVGYPIDWRCQLTPRPSHLWRFQLHYHENLFNIVLKPDDVVPEPHETHWDLAWEIILHWIENNRPQDAETADDAWHPYCISRRAPVWMKMVAIQPPDDAAPVFCSLIDQIDSLSHNLETDLRGNHLLENLHTLAMAGCFFDSEQATQWRTQALRMLKHELDFQTLPSGEHYERSPMYHCVVLANLLQLVIVSKNVDTALHDMAHRYAQRMMDFLVQIIRPDGEIPLLADSCYEEAPSVEQILEFAPLAGIELNCSEQTGGRTVGNYWVHESDRDWLLLDAGPVAADGLPGHAHCDLLNVIGSVGGQQLIVDSGNGSYGLDATRTYCRSSLAHNVLTVDQMDHCDVWSKFRMGFQGRVLNFRSGATGCFDWAIASHDAYRRIGIPQITRLVACHRDRICWLCVDYVPIGASGHELQGFLHFDDSVQLSQVDKNRLTATLDAGIFCVNFVGSERIQLAKGQVCHAFGKCVEAPAVVYSGTTPENRMIGWCVVPKNSSVDVQLNPDAAVLTVTLENQPTEFELDQR